MQIKSIKSQLAIISLLFFVFVAIVLFQIYNTHGMQSKELQYLRSSHDIISSYLAIEEEERKYIIESLRNIVDSKGDLRHLNELNDIEQRLVRWREDIENWDKDYRQWEKDYHVNVKNSYFNESFLSKRKRQGESYANAVLLCKEGKFSEAGSLLDIETQYLPPVNSTIIKLLDGIKEQIQFKQAIARQFYFGIAIAVLAALVALILASIGIFRNITISLMKLDEGARRISKGDLSQNIAITSPTELSSLAKSFNNMQNSIKVRDAKICEDAEEVRKLNESLENKVLERNRTILQQNSALKRKNEELEQILYAASHDLRTPLISIQGFSEELKSSCATLNEELSKGAASDQARIADLSENEIGVALNYIINGSKRMELLLEGLLRLSRMGRESLKIEPLNMNELLQNVVGGLGFQIQESDASINIADLHDCMGDRSQLEQVFSNLIGNAIKYRSKEVQPKIEIRSEQDSEHVRYFVSDNGIGIRKEHLDRVFHAFFRVDEDIAKGDGIGLAIVNRALDLHNGRAWAESEPGKGSTFIIEIPRQEEHPAS